jgi:hypothetical protein
MNWDFRSDLVFWTNITAVAGATGDAADRLYATVITNGWSIQVAFTFNLVTGASTNTAKAIAMNKDPNPGRLATPCEGNGVQVRSPVSLALPVLGQTSGRQQQKPPVQKQAGAKRMTVAPDSRSLILRSASIVVFQIEASRPAEAPNQSDVGVTLLEIVKGTLEQHAGDRVRLLVTQHPPNPETAPVGVWTPIQFTPGLKLVAFSKGGTNQAAMALTDPLCERLIPADEALPDVTFVRDLEAANLASATIVAHARQRANALGYLGAEYLAARLMEHALPDLATFDQLMQLAEAPALRQQPRDLLVEELTVKIADSDQPAAAIVQRGVIGLFHVAETNQDAQLRSRIYNHYLPEVLHLDHPKPVSARDVFQGRDRELFRARGALQDHKKELGASALLEWITR